LTFTRIDLNLGRGLVLEHDLDQGTHRWAQIMTIIIRRMVEISLARIRADTRVRVHVHQKSQANPRTRARKLVNFREEILLVTMVI
jgi:hypothetical protein